MPRTQQKTGSNEVWGFVSNWKEEQWTAQAAKHQPRAWRLTASPLCILDHSIPVRPSEDLCGGWHPAKDPILSGLPQPPVPCPLWSRALIDCKPLPLESGSARKAAASLPQLLPFFITIFSAFHFLGQEEAQGAHLFLSSRSSVPRRSIILLLMCAHVPQWTTKTPRMAKEIRTGSEQHPPPPPSSGPRWWKRPPATRWYPRPSGESVPHRSKPFH